MLAPHFEIYTIIDMLTSECTYIRDDNEMRNNIAHETGKDRSKEKKINDDIKNIITSALNDSRDFNMNKEDGIRISNLFFESSAGASNVSAKRTQKRIIIEYDIYELNPTAFELTVKQSIIDISKNEAITDALSFGATKEAVQVFQIKINHYNLP
jgi:hypothetical protein